MRQLNERAVDHALDHIAGARKRADTADDLIAEEAWREITRLAGQLQRERRLIARAIKLGAHRR